MRGEVCDVGVGEVIYNCLMNVVGSKNSKNVVSLEQLVPQHDCLKLLILHTPYTLVIDTLSLCVNLVKLDLSKNNLQVFPHLGNLTSLKFMFIHENTLDITALRGIFELNGKKSVLSQNIVWVTFWGNKNAFIGRHYIANQTNAIAIDRNMVVQHEKTANFPFPSPEPFSEETNISIFFERKGPANRFVTEEEYMRELWLEMAQLRKLHEKLFPIIKIQKVFRGWMVREKSRRFKRRKNESNQIIGECFFAWLQFANRQSKLRKILKAKDKDYLLLDLKEMRKQEKINRMIGIAREVKQKVFTRKNSLKNEIRFFNIVRQNYLLLKNLYSTLDVSSSKAVYIHKNQWEHFTRSVLPYLKLVNTEPAIPLSNEQFCLHLLYEFYSASKQFIKILQTNTKSMAYFTFRAQKRKQRKPFLYGSTLKPVYGAAHISTSRKLQLEEMVEKIEARRIIALGELIKFEGSQMLLQDIIKGVYFFNTGRLDGGNPNNQRIHVFTEFTLKKIASVTKIQKFWRGYSYRKKNEGHLKALLKFQRAAIIIQRWIRRLPTYRKKNFIYSTSKYLQSLNESTFYVQTEEYFSFLKEKQSSREGFSFCELDSKVYIHSQSNTLSLCWNAQSQQLQTMTNLRMGKWLFSRPFLKNKVGLTDQQIAVKMVFDPSKHLPSTYSHIFHYGTISSMVTKAKKTYLQVTCSSRSEAKFRIFVLLVCSYQLNKRNRLKIFDSQHFRQRDLAGRKEIGKDHVNFVCNQNFSLIKLCELRFQNEPNVRLHIITNSFYFQGQEKPLKAEEKFFVYTYNRDQLQKAVEQEQQQEENLQKYRTEQAKTRLGQFRLLTENVIESQGVQHKESEASGKMRILIKKRSVKQYKIDKRGKGKKQNQHNFLLDSMSINDRLTTQPDIILTQVSNQENSAFQQNHDPFIERNQQKDNIKIRQRLTYIEKRNNSFKRREEESFTKRFVNLGNFIQNQYVNDYRRRIKTELECRAADSAEHVRRDIERSQSQKIQDNHQKHKKIREKHNQHKELIEKTQSLMRDHSLQMRNGVVETRERKLKERAKLKRLKVSFAEECYPLASKNRKQQYFI